MNTENDQRAIDQKAADAAYDEAVRRFGAAVESFHRGQTEAALAEFRQLSKATREEPALAERAAMYTRLCERRMAPSPGDPATPEDCYRLGVVRSNGGDLDEALRLFDRALGAEPSSPRYLYARASAYALKGHKEAAIGDLRQAIALDPPVRFQAVNDPDFDPIREEPAFIDIIEPTPTGA
jgi:tetratricopeptide (TPR) repeat protein